MVLNSKLIDETVKKISASMPAGARRLQEDIEKNVRAALTAALARLDLVTREEFEVQKAVLQRSRERLEALEQQLAELEARTAASNTDSDKP